MTDAHYVLEVRNHPDRPNKPAGIYVQTITTGGETHTHYTGPALAMGYAWAEDRRMPAPRIRQITTALQDKSDNRVVVVLPVMASPYAFEDEHGLEVYPNENRRTFPVVPFYYSTPYANDHWPLYRGQDVSGCPDGTRLHVLGANSTHVNNGDTLHIAYSVRTGIWPGCAVALDDSAVLQLVEDAPKWPGYHGPIRVQCAESQGDHHDGVTVVYDPREPGSGPPIGGDFRDSYCIWTDLPGATLAERRDAAHASLDAAMALGVPARHVYRLMTANQCNKLHYHLLARVYAQANCLVPNIDFTDYRRVYRVAGGAVHVEAVDAPIAHQWTIDIDGQYPRAAVVRNVGILHPQKRGPLCPFAQLCDMLIKMRAEAKRSGQPEVARAFKLAVNSLIGYMNCTTSAFRVPRVTSTIVRVGINSLVNLCFSVSKSGGAITAFRTDSVSFVPPGRNPTRAEAERIANAAVALFNAKSGFTCAVETRTERAMHFSNRAAALAVREDGSRFVLLTGYSHALFPSDNRCCTEAVFKERCPNDYAKLMSPTKPFYDVAYPPPQ